MAKIVKILILEDSQERIEQFNERFSEFQTFVIKPTFVEHAEDAISCLKTNTYDFIFLDHDLNGSAFSSTSSEDCGMRVAEFLEDRKNRDRQGTVLIHSMNPGAAQSMNKIINKSVRMPALWTYSVFWKVFPRKDS